MNKLKTYLINLPRSADRKKAMTDQLGQINSIDLNIVIAINGRTLNAETLSQVYNREKSVRYLYREMTMPEIGCALSHFKCYQTLLTSDDPYSLILEDDIAMTKPDVFKDISWLPDFMSIEQARILLCTPHTIIKTHTKQQLNEHVTVAHYFSGVLAAGYIINRAAAKYLLEHYYPVYYLADSWREMKAKDIEMWALTEPAITLHALSEVSTIEKKVLKPLKQKRQKTVKESLAGFSYRLRKKFGLAIGTLEKI